MSTANDKAKADAEAKAKADAEAKAKADAEAKAKADAEAKAKAAGPTHIRVRVRARAQASFRRAGMTFGQQPTDLALAALSEAQVKAITSEPALTAEFVTLT